LDILVAVGAAYIVLRPSLRAAFAYVIGALAVFGATIGALDASWNGLAPRQLPAFLLAPAGLALLAAGILALRRKARVGGVPRAGRLALTFVAAVLPPDFPVVSIGAPLRLTGSPRVAVRTFAVPHENVTLRTPDGVRLAAWYVPPRNRAAVVLVHGGGGDRDGLKLHATMLARHGYGVLLYDERGRGS